MKLILRPGGSKDQEALLDLFDEAVVWLTSRGLNGQWGSQTWSDQPELRESVVKMVIAPGLTIAEIDSQVVGALIVKDESPPYVPQASEPDLYIELLIVSRQHAGHGVGSILLNHARSECRDRGRTFLRVDCWAGGNRDLVRYYEQAGFTATETFIQGDWPGQLLVQRLAP
jgi:GNAT superfamily N-acetyltransferase